MSDLDPEYVFIHFSVALLLLFVGFALLSIGHLFKNTIAYGVGSLFTLESLAIVIIILSVLVFSDNKN